MAIYMYICAWFASGGKRQLGLPTDETISMYMQLERGELAVR
jgi:hypothetical protein